MDVALKLVGRESQEQQLNTVNAQDQAKKSPTAAPRAYSEFPGLRHETKDVLQQLQQNIQLLEDLGGRLGYMMSEVRGLIRR